MIFPISSVSGIRTRVSRVKTDHYNQLNQYGCNTVMGIEPKSFSIGMRTDQCHCIELLGALNLCAYRESNPGLTLGRGKFYHCTIGAKYILFGFRQNMSFPLLTVGIEPTTTRLRASRSTDWARQASCISLWRITFQVHQAGFEPAKHEAWHLKCHPFDQTRVLV